MVHRQSHRASVRRRRFSILLAAFAMLFAGWWMTVFAVMSIDPLDLYPWGKTVKLRDVDYKPGETMQLVDVVAKLQGMDVIMIGTSTSAPFTRKMLRDAFPGSRDAFNLSYVGSRLGDRAQVAAEVARLSHAKRVLLAIDWTYVLQDTNGFVENFPSYLYDGNPFNDMRAVGFGTVRLALEAWRDQPLWQPGWEFVDYQRLRERSFKKFQTLAAMDLIAASIRRHRKDIDAPTPLSCGDLRAVHDQLVPFARQMAARGIALDAFFPPYSLAFYYEWLDDPRRRALTGNFVFSEQLLLRRCVVDALAGLPGVRVHGFDNDDKLNSDLENYSDTGHVFGDDNYRYLISAIADGSHTLTAENIDAYLDKFHRGVKSYVLKDTGIGVSDVSRN